MGSKLLRAVESILYDTATNMRGGWMVSAGAGGEPTKSMQRQRLSDVIVSAVISGCVLRS